jgi:succinyl-diaminopimelate desuccinylase
MIETHASTLEIAQALIARPSITPHDGDCQKLIAQYLQPLGFKIQSLPVGEVQNLWAICGNQHPIIAFAGHTDVVPIGNLSDWKSDPFEPTIREGYLYGRGAADMKGSIAAMLKACQQFIHQNPDFPGSIAFLLTSDEEGPAINGTVKIVEYLKTQGIHLDYCIVGEPSSHQAVGDVIKIGRRGSLGCTLKILGKQGHVAYPQKADNPIHRALLPLEKLTQFPWDQGNSAFPATTLQISNIRGGTGATNVIPAVLECEFTLRFSTEITPESIQKQVEAILEESHCQYICDWKLSGLPFLTNQGKLLSCTLEAIKEITGLNPELSTDGGTSDGRFIAPTGCEVIELGPSNATIHSINECVKVADVEQLSTIYQRILTKVLVDSDLAPPYSKKE